PAPRRSRELPPPADPQPRPQARREGEPRAGAPVGDTSRSGGSDGDERNRCGAGAGHGLAGEPALQGTGSYGERSASSFSSQAGGCGPGGTSLIPSVTAHRSSQPDPPPTKRSGWA